MSSQRRTPHIREHGSLLARVEKRALIWIANRLPHSVNFSRFSVS